MTPRTYYLTDIEARNMIYNDDLYETGTVRVVERISRPFISTQLFFNVDNKTFSLKIPSSKDRDIIFSNQERFYRLTVTKDTFTGKLFYSLACPEVVLKGHPFPFWGSPEVEG